MSMLNSLRRRKTFTEGSLSDEKKSSFENLVKRTLRISKKDHPAISSETEFKEPEEPDQLDPLPPKNLETSKLDFELKKKEIHLHNGENILKKLRAVALLVKTAEVNYILPKGDLYVTNYQLVFKSRIIDHLSQAEETPFPVKDKNANEVLNIETTIYVPYMLMNYLHRKTLGKQEQLKIYCYDMRDIKFIASSKKANFLAKVIEDYISLPENSMEKLFAFHYKWTPPTDIIDGWKLYNIETEFFRMGIPDADWKLVDWNRNFEIANTYPPILCVPSSITEEEIKAVADFRSKGRIPVLCWKSPSKKATISRCSQPYVGLTGRTSKEDEKLMKEIYNTNERENTFLHIMDARPKANAVGNKAKGLGYEYNSETSRINFMGIDNIHAVRESFVKMFELLNKDNVDNGVWFATLEATGWLRHISTIVGGSVDVAKRIIAGDSVLIHCSDGWDRTSQISSLAQMMLDPFYRTLEGIEILIEKEWLSFGHKFGERCGQAGKENERSPIFLQWLDCIHQVMHQFPISFEFNSKFLLTLADEVYSCRFGTFLHNSYAERVQAKLSERTVSIWSFINANYEQYKNMFYQPRADPIIPSFSTRRLVVWEDFFFRHETPWKQKEDPLEVATEMVQKLEGQLNSVNKQTKKQEQSHWKQLVEIMTQERKARKRQAELEAKIVIENVLNSVFEHVEAVMQHDMLLINDDSKSEIGTDLESKHGGKRPNWIPDAWAPACHKCKKGFTQIRRKHHCRACGNVFCNTCSANKLALPSFMYFDPVRVCDKCFGTLEEEVAVHLP